MAGPHLPSGQGDSPRRTVPGISGGPSSHELGYDVRGDAAAPSSAVSCHMTTHEQPHPDPGPHSIFRITTTRPVAILMVVVAVAVFGAVSYRRLALTLMPDLSYPKLTVRTEYPGAAPEEVEDAISRRVEQALGVVSNLAGLSSISKAEMSDVILEFAWGTDMTIATQEAREKLERVHLPEDAERPLILRYDPALDPILRLGLHGDRSLVELRRIADEEIKRGLESVSGVAAVRVKGGLEEQVLVEIDEKQLAILGLSISRINSQLAQENINLAGGRLKEGQTEYLVRTLNEFANVEEIGEIVIARPSGVEVRLRDVATVRKTHKEREVITRIDGTESVEIEVHKEADANIVAVAAAVRDRIFGSRKQREYVKALETKKPPRAKPGKKGKGPSPEVIRKRMTDFLSHSTPAGVKIEVLSDQSVFIRNAIAEVRDAALLGGLFAIVVLYLFLRQITSTLIVGVSIPISIVATLGPMHMFGVSLNIMSLGGLALGVGMLVDNSIVVLESIFRCREEGDGLTAGAVRGTSEVGGAVVASTLTTIAVFFPIVFVEGIAGQVFGDLAMTVVFSLLASLAVALFLIPMLASRHASSNAATRARSTLPSLTSITRVRAAERSRIPLACLAAVTVWPIAGLLMLCLALLVLAVKIVVVVLYVVVSPLLRLVVLVRPTRGQWPIERTWIQKSNEFLLSDLGKLGGIWPGVFAFDIQDCARRSLATFWDWSTSGRWWRRALKWTLWPLFLAYVIVRLVFHFVTSCVGKLLMIAFLLLASLGLWIGALAIGAVLVPLVPAAWVFSLVYGSIGRANPPVLGWALSQRHAVAAVSAGGLAATLYFVAPQLGTELIPEVHQGEFNAEVSLPVGTPLATTDATVQPLESLALEQTEVAKATSTVGVEPDADTSLEEGEHTAVITVSLKPGRDVAGLEEAVIATLRDGASRIPQVDLKISRATLFTFKTPIEVEVRSHDLDRLRRVSRDVEQALRGLGCLRDVKCSVQRGNPEVQITYDRNRLADLGLKLHEVATLVREKVHGKVATRYRDRERRIDVLVRVKEEHKATVADLSRLTVNPGGKVPIPLSAVAELHVAEGPSEIRRIDQRRSAVVSAAADRVDLGTAIARIGDALADVGRPADVTLAIAGQSQEMERSLRSLKFALALAVLLVYVVMASQFESLLHPFVIIFSVPLGFVGVIFTLYALNIPLSIVVFLGAIMLSGIVVNDAFVLVDCINQLRRRGTPKLEAVVQAGRLRLRPILMTTLTTILGLTPMALGLGPGAEIRAPMAITVIAGLISATVLTLVVIPSVYALLDRGE